MVFTITRTPHISRVAKKKATSVSVCVSAAMTVTPFICNTSEKIRQTASVSPLAYATFIKSTNDE